MDNKELKVGDVEVISCHENAEVPYELVREVVNFVPIEGKMAPNFRLFTRNIRDIEGDAIKKENEAAVKLKEAQDAQAVAEKAKQKVAKSKAKKEE